MIGRKLNLMVSAVGIIFLSGCATSPPQGGRQVAEFSEVKTISANGEINPEIKNGESTPPKLIKTDVTPLTVFEDLDLDDAKANGGRFSNTYTRILITSETYNNQTGTAEDTLKYTPSNAVARFLVGKKYDLNLSAKVKVGDYEATIPLLTLSQSSNRDGEQWARSIRHKLLNFPLFLVRDDGEASVPDIRLNFSGSKEYTSNMAGSALQIAVAGIQQVAPEAAVLTKLTAQTSKDKARAIDDAIGKLFSSGIQEEHVAHREMRKWRHAGGIKLTLQIPQTDKAWSEPYAEVGTWTITFDDPRPSIFSDWRVCDTAKDELRCRANRPDALKAVHKSLKDNVGQVLGYPLVKETNGLGTVRAYIVQQSWYTAALSAFNGDQAADVKTAEDLCRNALASITGLGLNGDDANIVVYAMIEGLPTAHTMHEAAFTGAASCKRATAAVSQDFS